MAKKGKVRTQPENCAAERRLFEAATEFQRKMARVRPFFKETKTEYGKLPEEWSFLS